MTGWSTAAAEHLPALEAFVYPQEWTCVTFTALLATRAYDALHIHHVGSAVSEAVMLGSHGLLLPVLDPHTPTFPREIAHRLPLSLTVMGMEDSVTATERWLGRPPTRAVDYHLMRLAAPDWRGMPSPPEDLLVRQAAHPDLGGLYPLQRDYELEEVLLDPGFHDPRLCRAHLRRMLKEQIVYLAEMGGRLVAKAGTNARGRGYDQIGGVFTERGLRGRGIGGHVMTALLGHIYRQKVGACLFVKPENTSAVVLYKRLGFRITGRFRISYYMI